LDSIKSGFTQIIYPRSYSKTRQQQQEHPAFHQTQRIWILQSLNSLDSTLPSQNCVFGRAGLGFNPQNKQDKFSKNFSKQPVKQPIVKSKQLVVTCFYCMKKDHSVRFCKIRKYFVPKGFMKWIPKGCEVSNYKNKPNGPTFVRGPNLVA